MLWGSHDDKRDPVAMHRDRGSRGSRKGGRADRWYRWSRGRSIAIARFAVVRGGRGNLRFRTRQKEEKTQTVLYPERLARVFIRTFLTGSHAGPKRLLGVQRRFVRHNARHNNEKKLQNVYCRPPTRVLRTVRYGRRTLAHSLIMKTPGGLCASPRRCKRHENVHSSG